MHEHESREHSRLKKHLCTSGYDTGEHLVSVSLSFHAKKMHEVPPNSRGYLEDSMELVRYFLPDS